MRIVARTNEPVAEQRLAAEDRDDLRDHAEERQRDDVHLGVAEEPEQVLPQDRRRRPRTGRRSAVPKRRSSRSITSAPVSAGNENRISDRRHEDRPGEDRHAEHGHPRRPSRVGRRHEVDRAEDARHAGQREPDDPQVGPEGRRVRQLGVRWVAGPADVRGAAGGEVAGQDDQPAEQEQPERQRVEPREDHVRRADLERHEVVRQRRHGRGREQQHHDRAVHREQLVVALLVDQLEPRHRELAADHEREQAAEQEEPERRCQVQQPDPLVVGRREPGQDRRPLGHGATGDGEAGPAARCAASHASYSRPRDGTDRERHRRVVDAAELGALAAVVARRPRR